jgi:hypothetical protein
MFTVRFSMIAMMQRRMNTGNTWYIPSVYFVVVVLLLLLTSRAAGERNYDATRPLQSSSFYYFVNTDNPLINLSSEKYSQSTNYEDYF